MTTTRRAALLAIAAAIATATAAGATAWGGDLDARFGSGGKVTTDFGGSADIGGAIARRSDGGIVVAGFRSLGANVDFALAAYDRSGAPDPSFGVAGRVTTDLGVGSFDVPNGIDVYANGDIVVAGVSNVGGSLRFAVARYERSGTLDQGFGQGGVVLTSLPGSLGDSAADVRIQPDGKIVVAGTSNRPGQRQKIAVARYERDGELDDMFGTAGIALIDLGNPSDTASAVALQPNGKILVAAGTTDAFTFADVAVIRLRGDGRLDETFGASGVVRTSVSPLDFARDIDVREDGRIVLAGQTAGDLLLVEYEQDGALNEAFGAGGVVQTDLGSFADSANALRIAPSGDAIVAGGTSAAGSFDFVAARYDRDGRLDARFGTNGSVVTDIGAGSADFARGVTLTPDGSVLVAGTTGLGAGADFAVVQYDGR